MDKRQKKRIETLTDRLKNRRQQLSGAKAQPDEPGEAQRLQKEVDALEAELRELKETK